MGGWGAFETTTVEPAASALRNQPLCCITVSRRREIPKFGEKLGQETSLRGGTGDDLRRSGPRDASRGINGHVALVLTL